SIQHGGIPAPISVLAWTELSRVSVCFCRRNPGIARASARILYSSPYWIPDIGSQSRSETRVVLLRANLYLTSQSKNLSSTQHLGEHLRLIVWEAGKQFVGPLAIQDNHNAVFPGQAIRVILGNHVMAQ